MGQLFPQRNAVQLVVDSSLTGNLDDGIGSQILLLGDGQMRDGGAVGLHVGTLKGAVERVMDHQGALHGTADGGYHRHTVQPAQFVALFDRGVMRKFCQRKHRVVGGYGETDAVGGQLLDTALQGFAFLKQQNNAF